MKLLWRTADVGADGSQATILMIADQSGTYGVGEIASATTGQDILELLVGCEAILQELDVQNLNATLDAVSHVTDGNPTYGSAVQSAFDVALHDLIGKRRGVPAHMILGGNYRDTVSLSQTVDSKDVDAASLKPFTSIRLTHMQERNAGTNELNKVLDLLPSDMQIDINVSGGFDNPSLARTFFEGLLSAKFRSNVALVQPLSEFDFIGHAALRSSLPIPIILDASVRSAGHMAQIVQARAADRVIVNIDRIGGLREAMRVLSIAESAAIGAMAGGFSRTMIGAAAVVHLASAQHDCFPISLDQFPIHPEKEIASGIDITAGVATITEAVGLGLTLDDDFVQGFQPIK